MFNAIGSSFGLFQINLHPFTRKQIESACSRKIAHYSTTSKEFIQGLQTELYVRKLLNDFEGVRTWRTPDGSYADCKLKWDLVVEIKHDFYVLQVKSSQERAMKFIDEYGQIGPSVVWIEHNEPCDEDQLRNTLSELFGGLSLSHQAVARQISWQIRLSKALRSATRADIKTKQKMGYPQQELEEKILLTDPTIALAYKVLDTQLKEEVRVVKARDREVTEAYFQKLADESTFF